MNTEIKSLNPRQLAGQLIMIRIPNTVLDAETADFLRDNQIRAICLFRQNMVDAAQLSKLTADLREVMGENALIAIDQEGGAVVRSTWVPAPPAAMSLGAADDTTLAYAVGAAVARGVKALGFNWNFAPVLDLNNNPANPVICERSFGSDPKRATELALAWMEGSLSEGVACCVKHFPGHGDTHVDSHRDLPTVDKPRAELDALELAPFKVAAMATKNAPAMMSAHIVYPALDREFPATMSRKILTGLLREEWQYRGVIITDGMDMHAIAGRYGVGKAAVQAFVAGADMVMALGTRATQNETLDALAEAIASGQFHQEEIATRLQRLDRLAQTYPCAGTDGIYAAEAADHQLMRGAWQRGLTVHGNPQAIPVGSKIRLVMRTDTVSDGVSEAGVPASVVSAMLAQHYDVEMTTFADPDTFIWPSLPADGRITVLASTSRARYSEQVRNSWRPALHLALWNPFHAFDIAAPAVMSYGFAPPALQAVSAWLTGEIEAHGQLPVAGMM
ncbi:beta-N-acetylhexosaminidase [Glaciimonas soli]|nr:beta-N-acetylhexosaminidase [Glaciimonas soli]